MPEILLTLDRDMRVRHFYTKEPAHGVSFYVYDMATGSPVPGASVRVHGTSSRGTPFDATVPTDGDGRAVVGVLEGSEYYYAVWHPDYFGASGGPFEVTSDVSLEIGLEPTPTAEPYYPITWHVYDGKTGGPIEGASIRMCGVSDIGTWFDERGSTDASGVVVLMIPRGGRRGGAYYGSNFTYYYSIEHPSYASSFGVTYALSWRSLEQPLVPRTEPTVVVFRPGYDRATDILARWMRDVVDYAKLRGFEVLDLHNPAETCYPHFPDVLGEKGHYAVIAATHGGAYVLGTGTEFAEPCRLRNAEHTYIAIQSCKNDELLAGARVYNLACYTGVKLAKTTHEKGAPIAMGYVDTYVFMTGPYEWASKETGLEPAFALLDGLPAGDIFERVMRKYEEVMAVVAEGTEPEAATALDVLGHDRDAFIVYG